MNILQKIDGYKTYALLLVSVFFGIIEFMIKGDYSMSSFIVLSQQGWVVAVIAALRHGIAKAGNNGIVTKGAAVLLLFLALQCPVQAQTTTASTSTSPAISITSTISNAVQSVNVEGIVASLVPKAVNTGYFYNWKDEKIQMTFTYAPVAYNFSWGTVELNVGYASPDVLIGGPGLVLNVPVIEKKWGITAPASIQNILNSMSIVLEPMVGLEDVGGHNRFTGGPGASIKVTW